MLHIFSLRLPPLFMDLSKPRNHKSKRPTVAESDHHAVVPIVMKFRGTRTSFKYFRSTCGDTFRGGGGGGGCRTSRHLRVRIEPGARPENPPLKDCRLFVALLLRRERSCRTVRDLSGIRCHATLTHCNTCGPPEFGPKIILAGGPNDTRTVAKCLSDWSTELKTGAEEQADKTGKINRTDRIDKTDKIGKQTGRQTCGQIDSTSRANVTDTTHRTDKT